MVLLLLAVMWVGFGVWYVLGRPEGRSADSIVSFRRQLRVLERTGPVNIDPAHRMRNGGGGFGDTAFGVSSSSVAGLVPGQSFFGGPSSAALRRRRAQKRRRDVFFGLVLGVVGSFLLGFIPGLGVMWVLSGVFVVALMGYVFLLVQLTNLATERSMKVRFLPERPSADEPALLLRRSAN